MLKKFASLLLLSSSMIQAQIPVNHLKSLLKMSGCYEVEFNFQETESLHPDYKVKSELYHNSLVEFIAAEVDRERDTISFQHIGVTPHGMAFKHWRQDWVYAPNHVFDYLGNDTWVRRDLKPNPTHWAQKVYNIDDSPRYQGEALLNHPPMKSVWKAKSFAPLPRREYSTRSDYQILERENIHIIYGNRWVHKQWNRKLVKKSDGIIFPLVWEQGRNVYTKVDRSRCNAAILLWQQTREAWKVIKNSWTELMDSSWIVKLLKKRKVLCEEN